MKINKQNLLLAVILIIVIALGSLAFKQFTDINKSQSKKMNGSTPVIKNKTDSHLVKTANPVAIKSTQVNRLLKNDLPHWDTLFIECKDTTLFFVNKPDLEDASQEYKIAQEYPDLNAIYVTADYYESKGHYLIFKETGRIDTLWAFPFFNKSKSRFLSIADDDGMEGCPHGFQIWKKEADGGFVKTVELNQDKWNPHSTQWLDDSRFKVVANLMTQPSPEIFKVWNQHWDTLIFNAEELEIQADKLKPKATIEKYFAKFCTLQKGDSIINKPLKDYFEVRRISSREFNNSIPSRSHWHAAQQNFKTDDVITIVSAYGDTAKFIDYKDKEDSWGNKTYTVAGENYFYGYLVKEQGYESSTYYLVHKKMGRHKYSYEGFPLINEQTDILIEYTNYFHYDGGVSTINFVSDWYKGKSHQIHFKYFGDLINAYQAENGEMFIQLEKTEKEPSVYLALKMKKL